MRSVRAASLFAAVVVTSVASAQELPAQDGREAVVQALDWLARHQRVDGSWSAETWIARCAADGGCTGPPGAGGPQFDVGVTALATLAFLRAGLVDHDERRRVVERAVLWLRAQQRPDGSIGFEGGDRATRDHPWAKAALDLTTSAVQDGGADRARTLALGQTLHNHAWATHALALATGALDDAGTRAAAAEAVRFCLEAQSEGLGWKYGVRTGRSDTSVTAAMIEALDAASAARLDVPTAAFAGAVTWVRRVTDTNGDTGYETPGGGSTFLRASDGRFDALPVMTAAAIVVRLLADPRTNVADSVMLVLASKPVWEARRLNFVYWYYGTRASALVGGRPWATWRPALVGALVPAQRRGGCASGSWDAVDDWGPAGGRVYATALNALSLLVEPE
jgi:hypothetical protein